MTPDPEDGPEFDQPSDEPPTALLETVNAAEPDSVRRQVRAQRKRQRTSAEFWQEVLSTVEGRREAWAILDECHTFDNPAGIAANGSYDPAVTGLLHGQKAIGLKLFRRWLSLAPDQVSLMLSEHPLPEIGETPIKRSKNPNRGT